MKNKKNNGKINLKFTKKRLFFRCLFVFLLMSCLVFSAAGAKHNNNDNAKDENSNANTNSNENNNTNASPKPESTPSEGQNQERISDLNKTLEEKKKNISEIEAKIDTYQKMLEIKQAEQKTLASQINIADNQIEQTKEEIKKVENDIEVSDIEIQQLELKINEQSEQLKQKQATLRVLLNDLHRKDEKGLIEVLLSYSGIASFIQEIAYTEQANEGVFNKLQEINSIRKDLESKQQTQKDKHNELETNRQKKIDKTFSLEGEQGSREKLLTDTQGEESRYQQLLERVEEEKKSLLGDIEEFTASKSGELGSVISSQPKPTSGLASTDWYYSQRDSRWGGSDIGYSNTKMSKYGCAVTCVAMVLSYQGIAITPGILARQPIFSNDLIVWPDQWQYVKRVGGYSHGNIDWDVVDQEIANRNPVIVFVRANGRGAGHYVVVHHKDNNGKYVVHDPYWGTNIYLNSTKENISTLYGSGTSVDQMIIYHNTKRDGSSSPPLDIPATKLNSNVNNNVTVDSNKNTNSNKNKNKSKQ